jgi:hypothetical protein
MADVPASVLALARIKWAAHGYVAPVETYYGVARDIRARIAPLIMAEAKARPNYGCLNPKHRAQNCQGDGADCIPRKKPLASEDFLTFTYQGKTVTLTSVKLAKLLHKLQSAPGRFFTRAELMDAIGMSVEVYDRSLSTNIKRLRRELRKHWSDVPIITKYKAGYMWDGDDTKEDVA